MQTIKRVFHEYLMGAAQLFDFTGVLATRPHSTPKKMSPQQALLNDYAAICGDAGRGDLSGFHWPRHDCRHHWFG